MRIVIEIRNAEVQKQMLLLYQDKLKKKMGKEEKENVSS